MTSGGLFLLSLVQASEHVKSLASCCCGKYSIFSQVVRYWQESQGQSSSRLSACAEHNQEEELLVWRSGLLC